VIKHRNIIRSRLTNQTNPDKEMRRNPGYIAGSSLPGSVDCPGIFCPTQQDYR